MAFEVSQVNCPAGAVTPLFTIPAGMVNVTFWNASTAVCYVGTGTAVTSSNGMVCHSIPTSFYMYATSKGATFFGTAPSGTAQVNYIIVANS